MSQSTTILLSTPAAATTSALVQVIETSTGKGKAAVFSGIKYDLAFGLNSEMHCNTGILPVKFRVSPSERFPDTGSGVFEVTPKLDKFLAHALSDTAGHIETGDDEPWIPVSDAVTAHLAPTKTKKDKKSKAKATGAAAVKKAIAEAIAAATIYSDKRGELVRFAVDMAGSKGNKVPSVPAVWMVDGDSSPAPGDGSPLAPPNVASLTLKGHFWVKLMSEFGKPLKFSAQLRFRILTARVYPVEEVPLDPIEGETLLDSDDEAMLSSLKIVAPPGAAARQSDSDASSESGDDDEGPSSDDNSDDTDDSDSSAVESPVPDDSPMPVADSPEAAQTRPSRKRRRTEKAQ